MLCSEGSKLHWLIDMMRTNQNLLLFWKSVLKMRKLYISISGSCSLFIGKSDRSIDRNSHGHTRIPCIVKIGKKLWQSFLSRTFSGQLTFRQNIIALYIPVWAASSEFVSSSIPSWQILTAHAQPFRGARDLAFCLKVPLDTACMSEQRRFWRDCADAQARLNLRCSHRR